MAANPPNINTIPIVDSIWGTDGSTLSQRERDFVHRFLPYALLEAQRSGMPWQFILGEASLESDWGQSASARNDNNMFGIKAPNSWMTDGVHQEGVDYSVRETRDIVNGREVRRPQPFIKYPSQEAAFKSFGEKLRTSSRPTQRAIYNDFKAVDPLHPTEDEQILIADAFNRSDYADEPLAGERIQSRASRAPTDWEAAGFKVARSYNKDSNIAYDNAERLGIDLSTLGITPNQGELTPAQVAQIRTRVGADWRSVTVPAPFTLIPGDNSPGGGINGYPGFGSGGQSQDFNTGANRLLDLNLGGGAPNPEPPSWFSAKAYTDANPDVAAATHGDPRAAWEHYRTFGNPENRLLDLSGTRFDNQTYFTRNPDVAQSGMGALDHWLDFGGGEGRKAFLRRPGAMEPTEVPAGKGLSPLSPWAPSFDVISYLRQNPDIAKAGVDPVEHWQGPGQRENRVINDKGQRFSDLAPWAPSFDAVKYLLANPDVEKAGVDAFQHARDFGSAENRLLDLSGRRLNDIKVPMNPLLEPGVTEGAPGITPTQGPPPGLTPTEGPPGLTPTEAPPGTTATQVPGLLTPTEGPPGTTATQVPGLLTPTEGAPGLTVPRFPDLTPTEGPPGTTATQFPGLLTPTEGAPGLTPTQEPPGLTPTEGPPGTTETRFPGLLAPTEGAPGLTPTQGPPGLTPTLGPTDFIPAGTELPPWMPAFDVAAYLRQNPDIITGGEGNDAIGHARRSGQYEDRIINDRGQRFSDFGPPPPLTPTQGPSGLTPTQGPPGLSPAGTQLPAWMPAFDIDSYLRQNPDIIAGGQGDDAIGHARRSGQYEDRIINDRGQRFSDFGPPPPLSPNWSPTPTQGPPGPSPAGTPLPAWMPAFDIDAYLRQNPDIIAGGQGNDAIGHAIRSGQYEDRIINDRGQRFSDFAPRPPVQTQGQQPFPTGTQLPAWMPAFDIDAYLRQNPDIIAGGQGNDAIGHAIRSGQYEDRIINDKGQRFSDVAPRPLPPPDAQRPFPAGTPLPAWMPAFDVDAYLRQNPDIIAGGEGNDAIGHALRSGQYEDRIINDQGQRFSDVAPGLIPRFTQGQGGGDFATGQNGFFPGNYFTQPPDRSWRDLSPAEDGWVEPIPLGSGISYNGNQTLYGGVPLGLDGGRPNLFDPQSSENAYLAGQRQYAANEIARAKMSEAQLLSDGAPTYRIPTGINTPDRIAPLPILGMGAPGYVGQGLSGPNYLPQSMFSGGGLFR